MLQCVAQLHYALCTMLTCIDVYREEIVIYFHYGFSPYL